MLAAKHGNLDDLESQPTLAAISRYSGTLYSAIHGRGLKGTPTANNALTDFELARAETSVLIQSALFGLISATDQIPEYKIAVNKNLNGLNLKKHWAVAHQDLWSAFEGRPVIDLRSKAYVELAPLPEWLESYRVEVFYRSPDGQLAQMNHFNKKAKGQLVRASLTMPAVNIDLAHLPDLARQVGLELSINGQSIQLVTQQST